ncbi:MAG: ABC transporter permease [Anaerolineae bacterium]|nr:ABC transporter permease [Anaerolineae bacterium]
MEHMEDAGKRSETGVKPVAKLKGFGSSILGLVDRLGPWSALVIVVLFFSWWEFISRTEMVSTLFFPTPTSIFSTLVEMITTGKLTEDFLATMRRVFSGFLIGGSVGLLLGLSMGWIARLRIVLDPIVAAVHPIPKISLLPIILVIFGFGEMSRTVMVSIAAFFPMLINSMAGVTQINPTYFEVARNYGASQWKIFRRVVLPASLPLVLTGARLALTMSLTITIVVEIRWEVQVWEPTSGWPGKHCALRSCTRW